jgi:hypothetical protein
MESAPTTDLNDTNQCTTAKKKSKKFPTDCKICGAPALYSYVSIVVCGSCKIFFRRNARIKQVRSNYTRIFFYLYKFVLGSIQMFL